MTRVLHSGDPRGEDYRATQEWTVDIRSRLSHIRGELEDIGRIQSMFPHDRLPDRVAGTLTLCLMALYELVEGPRSFAATADRLDELWADVARNPKSYTIRDGETWEWRPWGIFKRGGPEPKSPASSSPA